MFRVAARSFQDWYEVGLGLSCWGVSVESDKVEQRGRKAGVGVLLSKALELEDGYVPTLWRPLAPGVQSTQTSGLLEEKRSWIWLYSQSKVRCWIDAFCLHIRIAPMEKGLTHPCVILGLEISYTRGAHKKSAAMELGAPQTKNSSCGWLWPGLHHLYIATTINLRLKANIRSQLYRESYYLSPHTIYKLLLVTRFWA